MGRTVDYGAARMGTFAAPWEYCDDEYAARAKRVQEASEGFSRNPEVHCQAEHPFQRAKSYLQRQPKPPAEPSPSTRRVPRLRVANSKGEPLTFGALTHREYATVGTQGDKDSPNGPQSARLWDSSKSWNTKALRAPLPGTNLSPRRTGIAGYAGHIPYAREVFGRNYQDMKKTARNRETLPAIECPSVSIPSRTYYSKCSREIKTPLKLIRNRNSGVLGDDRLCEFSSVSHSSFPEYSEAEPEAEMSEEEVKTMYRYATNRVSSERVNAMEAMLRQKINQRTKGGGFALRRAFKFFDRDGSGGVSCNELRAGLRDFGLQYSDEEVCALMARYDETFQNDVNYYKFVDKILKDSWSGK